MAKRNNWTRKETIIAFNIYCKIPFKSSSKTNPTIIKYANIIGRSPSALNMKVGNFGRLYPELKKYQNQPIILPDKFLPSKDFLDFHYQTIFKK